MNMDISEYTVRIDLAQLYPPQPLVATGNPTALGELSAVWISVAAAFPIRKNWCEPTKPRTASRNRRPPAIFCRGARTGGACSSEAKRTVNPPVVAKWLWVAGSAE